ncbi:MAG: ABC transporter permease [Anaerolineales bacterium]|jgi:NitT/TauT family transport system permease protein
MEIQKAGKRSPKPIDTLRFKRAYQVPLSLVAGLALWYIVARLGRFPPIILPTPYHVWQRLLQALRDGSLLFHSMITISEVLSGLTLGVFTATLLGYLLAKSRAAERLLAPYIVASQSVPIVAIAPLLVIWFGPGLLSKVLICALIVFFPVLINTIVGIRSVPEELLELMRSLKASRWQILRLLEFPAALPVFLGGLRIGATLAVIGAVVGEFVGADRGLGFLINVGRGLYDTALVFVAIFALVIIAVSLYGTVIIAESQLLSWQEK